jgi:hypothetical protein
MSIEAAASCTCDSLKGSAFEEVEGASAAPAHPLKHSGDGESRKGSK